MNRRGSGSGWSVPSELASYPWVTPGEQRCYRYLCAKANHHGETANLSQPALAAALKVTEQTIRRWTANLAQLRMLRAEAQGQGRGYVYVLRPASAWITDRSSGFASSDELRAQLGEPVTREQLDAWKAERQGAPSEPETASPETLHL